VHERALYQLPKEFTRVHAMGPARNTTHGMQRLRLRYH